MFNYDDPIVRPGEREIPLADALAQILHDAPMVSHYKMIENRLIEFRYRDRNVWWAWFDEGIPSVVGFTWQNYIASKLIRHWDDMQRDKWDAEHWYQH